MYDYAVGGSIVSDVSVQINALFLADDGVGPKPSWAPWTARDTLFGDSLSD